MADKFSLDDILAEVDRKKSKNAGGSAKETDLSVTSILADEEIRERLNGESGGANSSAENMSAAENPAPKEEKKEQKPSREERLEEPESPQKSVSPDKKQSEQPKEQESSEEKSAAKSAEHFEERSEAQPEESKPRKKSDKFFKKAKKAEKKAEKQAERQEKAESAEEDEKPFSPAFSPDFDDDGDFEMDEADVDLDSIFGKKKKQPESGEPVLVAAPKKSRPASDGAKKDEKLLSRDIAAEESDEQLDSLNPYELKSKADADSIETIAAAALSGDTIGVAGNELKALSKREITSDTNEVTMVIKDRTEAKSEAPDGDTAEIVREYKKGGNGGLFEAADKEKRSTTALVDSINKSLAKKREENLAASQPVSLTENSTAEVKTPTLGLNIDYEKQILPDTGTIPSVDEFAVSEAKIRELKRKRKRKISEFVLEDIEDEDYDDEDEPQPQPEETADFDSYDGAEQIRSDLNESHRGLRTRFIILLILCAIVGIAAFAGDFGSGLNLELFGSNILNQRFVSKENAGFIYFNLIAGVLGLAVCSPVVLNGFGKLFRGKADCDSICSVTAVLSVLGAVIHLENPDYLQRGKAYLYIAAGLFALLFNTLGKLSMIVRAKRNFDFISGDHDKYYAYIVENEQQSEAITKGIVSDIPVLVTMRKTEFLTDFLKTSYCTDKADRISRYLTPISAAFAIAVGVIAYFVPNGIDGMENNPYWAITAALGTLSALSPFATMFIVNHPLAMASKALSKYNSTVLGYGAVEEFSETNCAAVDAKVLFPVGSIACTGMKTCRPANSVNNIVIDQAIILAASLAIKSGSVMSNMFENMINSKDDILVPIENCVYEDNMGVMGWYGTKRLILGNREQMKHHDIKVPDMNKTRKYRSDNTDLVYLAVGGEVVIIFLIEMTANAEIKETLREMTDRGISLAVKTTDSVVTVGKLADVFDISPEMIRILPYSLHEQFEDCTRYTPRGSGAISCDKTFTSFAKAVVGSKKLMKSINAGSCVMLAGLFFAAMFAVIFALFVKPEFFSPSAIILYNFGFMLLTMLVQRFTRY